MSALFFRGGVPAGNFSGNRAAPLSCRVGLIRLNEPAFRQVLGRLRPRAAPYSQEAPPSRTRG
ncbi:MAG: hypothetical protein WBV23_15320, partial [Desulfobaccales bacterium]